MFKAFCVIVILLLSDHAFVAQINMVQNPSFKEYNKCPGNRTLGFFNETALDWSKRTNEPEFFNKCNPNCFEELHGYAKLFDYRDSCFIVNGEVVIGFPMWTESVQTKLKSILLPNKNYYISYHTTQIRQHNRNNLSRKSGYGVFFAKDSIYELFKTIFETPQFLDTLTYSTDTSWQEICGCFEVKEPVQWMVVGNFLDQSKLFLNPPQEDSQSAYDDFFVSEIQETISLLVKDTILCEGDSLLLSTNHSLIKGEWLWKLEGTDSVYYHTSHVKPKYLKAGDYKVELQVKHCSGIYNYAGSQVIHVQSKPKKQFESYREISVDSGMVITLDPCYLGSSYDWVGIDLSCQNCENPKLVVSQNQIITLIINKNQTCEELCTIAIKVKKKPQAIFTLSDNQLCENDCIRLNNNSVNANSMYYYMVIGPEYWSDSSSSDITICLRKTGIYSLKCFVKNEFYTDSLIMNQTISVSSRPSILPSTKEYLVNSDTVLALTPCFSGSHYFWHGMEGLSCNDCSFPFIKVQGNGVLKLIVYNESRNCADSCEYKIIVNQQPHKIYAPNIFSPNGDGLNDYWQLFGKNFKIVSIRIYDRWGELIWQRENFPSNDPNNGWDGTFSGKAVNPGVYVWVADLLLTDGRKVVEKGDVTVVR